MTSARSVPSAEVEAASFEALVPSAAWTTLDPDSLGAWGTFLVLGRWTALPRARELSLAWRGDILSVFAGSAAPADTLFSWRIELGDEASARAVAGLAEASFGARNVRQSGSRVALMWASNGASAEWALSL